MEGKFNEKGELIITRAHREVNMQCMYQKGTPCGEWCPQLSEPFIQPNNETKKVHAVLHVCQNKHWKFTAFEDRRQLK